MKENQKNVPTAAAATLSSAVAVANLSLKKSGGSEPMTRDRSSGSEPISINRNRPITFKKWGMKSNEEGNLIHPGPGIIMPC